MKHPARGQPELSPYQTAMAARGKDYGPISTSHGEGSVAEVQGYFHALNIALSTWASHWSMAESTSSKYHEAH